ncbi:zinc finger protein 532 isoform X1 [Megalops cyprinoides]|uniref:zinc finger protein 532 isoform X1 n=1 Tax=Megalops cyprinoides TaxID=118141 RepID=UPI001864A363|nr:zinc finger protein 532 isoform X1 [Megalops cyprinoides]XP_036385573.1 zinc finger protein 532 isoform X1 [Megalops cyprinoides]XP_036385574.1 zinc finger protein 532 isoform X1 [Megalops cyprinoides]XP_036385576.1 zinc finger protein 532 isoform X1 [Megalops cyprinoides]XP_036385577.1 zinc finger protein 532 isoform X1 [Megalops cyprinoides]
MGDMKTPDFDDLLAAFDIPDMVDPKAAIESGHDDHEGQLKHSVPSEEESNVPSAPDVGVSVIVKNIRNIDASEQTLADKEIHPSMGNGLHNGFLAMSPGDRYVKDSGKSQKDEGHGLAISNSSFNQFSPISSAEEFDDDDKIEVDDPSDKQASLPGFRPNPLMGSAVKREEEMPKAGVADILSKPGTNGNFDKSKIEGGNSTLGGLNLYDLQKPRKLEEQPKEMVPKSKEGKECGDAAGLNVSSLSQAKAKSSAKLSSCIAAIAALSAKKATTDCAVPELHTTSRDSPMEARESPRVTDKPSEPESALELAKRMLSKQPESPCSVTSESSSKGSPSSQGGSVPVIPKVRIKTIKTSSGQIKRTVTRVLPVFDPEDLKKGADPTSIVVSSLLSSPTSTSVFSSPSRTALPTTVVATSASSAMEVTKQMTIKPVATAFLPVSAVKTAGSQVINLKLANNTTVKATVIPAASVQSASSAILKAANAIQQQTVMVPASSLANAKLVPKTVHLTNLNLLPQTSTTSTELHQVLNKPQQPIKQAMITTQPPKKVSRVQVLASSQSSVVEAFNKVLSSINPVPVYVPNLSPPSAACISIPSRGYKCLECGDSFALEKSLTQHYDRRSVRIEVTCNHCAKNLVFYNKCSLLSHARGHKDKGVVMQCSHLILKPIPADQMIATPAHSSVVATATIHNSNSLGKAGPGVVSTVISAPSTAPVVAAMPLDEDSSRLCRHSLKCLECSEMFQDEASLAMHYQQAVESSGQKTCNICLMLLPNQCSFVSHQRIHQHKSPYVCPECGAICRSVHFQTHITKNCLHYTRRVGYRCVHCSVIYADVAALKSHIQGTHCEIFYKCPICPMAFKSAPGTHSHAYTQHPGVKIGEPKLIYKCSMCDTVFTQQTLLYSHFDQHIANQKVSVFKCPDCSMHYAQKQLMLDHIKSMHGTLKTIEGPPNLGINLPLTSKPTNPISPSPNCKEAGGAVNGFEKGEKKPPSPLKRANAGALPKKPPNPGWMCRECDRLFTQREVYISHMRREHGKQMKKHPCRQCDKSFSSSHSLCRHNRIKHKGLRKVFSCPLCPDSNRTFSKRLMLEKHTQLMHGIKDAEGTAVTDSANMEVDTEKDFAQASSPKRKPEDAGVDFRSRGAAAAPQPLKKLKINVFKVHKCAVCSFTTEDIVQFHEHIPQHKSDGSSHQCRECGLCYTSHNSLARHLFIVHKLKEPQTLSQHNGAGDEGQQENQPGPEDAADTKCKVCGKTFETEGALNTHMRTHGMAFIKSKRLNAAEK